MQQANTQPAAAKQPPKPKPVPPPEFEERAIATMGAPALIRVIDDRSSSEFQKAKACQRLGELGSKDAVPALGALLGDERLSTYARHGLETVADPSADAALRGALSRLKGDRLIGVINSIGKRKDAQATPALVAMLHGGDVEAARAAAAALGKIGAKTELVAALAKTKGPARTAVADGALVAAERLIEQGKRDEALDLYTILGAPDVPKPARLAAMSAIVREETSISRPR